MALSLTIGLVCAGRLAKADCGARAASLPVGIPSFHKVPEFHRRGPKALNPISGTTRLLYGLAEEMLHFTLCNSFFDEPVCNTETY